MTDEPELKPCPFCQGGSVEVVRCSDIAVWVRCCDCSATGPAENMASEAVKAWNARPTADQPA